MAASTGPLPTPPAAPSPINIPPPPTVSPPPTIGPPGTTIPPTLLTPEYVAEIVNLPDNVQATSNGVKLIGEIAVLPGASLIAEGRFSQGALIAALGILGGIAGGALLGPLGYLAVRYGASAVAYRESLAPSPARPPVPTPPTSNGAAQQQTMQAINMLAQHQAQGFNALSNYVVNVANHLAAHQQETANQLFAFQVQLRDSLMPSPRHGST